MFILVALNTKSRAVAIVQEGLQRVGHQKTEEIAAHEGVSPAAVSRQFTDPAWHLWFDGLCELPPKAQAAIAIRWLEDLGVLPAQDALSLGVLELLRRKKMAKATLMPQPELEMAL